MKKKKKPSLVEHVAWMNNTYPNSDWQQALNKTQKNI